MDPLRGLSRRTIVTRSVAGAAGVAVLFGLVTEAAAKNEPEIGRLSGHTIERSRVQQLLALPGAELLHDRRRRHQSEGLV
jgi:hypothetical protein